MSGAPWYHWEGPDLVLALRIQPRAATNEIVGPYDDRLKVRLTAPPVDGKANAHLIEFLADTFGVAKGRVHLLSGQSGRDKRVRIEAPQRLPNAIAKPTR